MKYSVKSLENIIYLKQYSEVSKGNYCNLRIIFTSDPTVNDAIV